MNCKYTGYPKTDAEPKLRFTATAFNQACLQKVRFVWQKQGFTEDKEEIPKWKFEETFPFEWSYGGQYIDSKHLELIRKNLFYIPVS